MSRGGRGQARAVGGAGCLRSEREGAIESGVEAWQGGVGRLEGEDIREAQLGDEAVLEGAPEAFDAGLR